MSGECDKCGEHCLDCKCYEKVNKEYLEILKREGYLETFPKKNARILFKVKQGKIQDLIVEEFSTPEEKQHLYADYPSDIGNCLSNWDDWTFSDVLIKIFVSYEVSVNLRKKIIFELSKVREWRPHLAFWILRNFAN